MCDLEDNKSYDQAKIFFQENKNLYKRHNAIENLDYNLRLQQNNYLNSFSLNSGHGNFITPKIYNNESISALEILNINTGKDSKHYKYPEMIKYHDISFRILLIDDKLGNEKGVVNPDKSKVKLIGDLMTGEILKEFAIIEDPKLEVVINKYIYERLIWKEKNIMRYIYSSKKQISATESVSILKHPSELSCKSENVQIVQVSNLVDAIFLLSYSNCKFDLVLMDYLLEDKIREASGRELATSFFEWLKDEDGKNSNIGYLKNVILNNFNCTIDCSSCDNNTTNECLKLNEDKRKTVINNRGPLRKFWFFPISSFSETLISDLVGKGIRLIDYYWHIEHGADPMITPFLFLRQLNNFLYLQLEEAVFSIIDLTDFIKNNILMIQNSFEDEKIDFTKFSSLMGSEYNKFIYDFHNRPLIYNDKDSSLFSNYIWNNFLAKAENENMFIAVQAYQKFLHRCAFGSKSDFKKMKHFWAETLIALDQLQDLDKNNIKDIDKMNDLLNRLSFE
jgi:hypothetical protein